MNSSTQSVDALRSERETLELREPLEAPNADWTIVLERGGELPIISIAS